MKKAFLFITIIMSIGLSFSISGCGGNKTDHEGEYEFDYYPEKNIYYSVESSKFIYSLDGGKQWDMVSLNLKEDPKILGKKEKIYSKKAEVWMENETHLKLYEGKPYLLITDDSKDYAATEDEVSDKRSFTKRATTVKKSVAVQKKKGVRGFFDKVFGKKDKK